jgi:hypothetical protein
MDLLSAALHPSNSFVTNRSLNTAFFRSFNVSNNQSFAMNVFVLLPEGVVQSRALVVALMFNPSTVNETNNNAPKKGERIHNDEYISCVKKV